MSRRLLAAAIAALTVIAAAILAVVTNVVTGKSLPSWADWLTAGNHAWWSLGGLIVLIAVLSVVASLLGQEPDRRRNSAAAPAAAWIDPQAPLPHEIRMDPPQDDDFYRVDDVRQISYLCRFNSAVLLVTGRAEGGAGEQNAARHFRRGDYQKVEPLKNAYGTVIAWFNVGSYDSFFFGRRDESPHHLGRFLAERGARHAGLHLFIDGKLVASRKYGFLQEVRAGSGYGPTIGQVAESLCEQHLTRQQ